VAASWREYFAASGIPPEEWDDEGYIEDPGGVWPSISFLKVPEGKREIPVTALN